MTIWEEPLRLIRPALPEGHRIIVTSDIHGNIPYFRGLLEKLKYTEEDILIIDGDFLERGPDSLGLLREIMALSRKGTVYTLCGNCDSWADILTTQDRFEDSFYWVGRYVRMRRSGLLWNMLQEQNIAVTEDLDILDTIIRIQDAYREEWEFLRNLPVALDTPGYLYVHGGVRPDIPLEQQNNGSCMKFDNFRARGYHFPKWVVVGHWPVMLYRSRCIDASPLVDLRQKVISIDGGCELERTGQLNAMVLPEFYSDAFSFESYDPFPEKTALDPQKPNKVSYYIRWGDNAVQVLKNEGEFSMCRHIRTGYTCEIPTSYLHAQEDGSYITRDYSDYRLDVEPGDRLRIVDKTSRGVIAKKNGRVGWYMGALQS